MTAKDFYNKKAFKYQLKRAITKDHNYFRDTIIELMELYAKEQVKIHCDKQNVKSVLSCSTCKYNRDRPSSAACIICYNQSEHKAI